MSEEASLTTSGRLRDVPEVPFINLRYEDPKDLATSYIIQIVEDVDEDGSA